MSLFKQFYLYCKTANPDLPEERRFAFCEHQFPIVQRALVYGEGLQACDSRAHDLTCSFIERSLTRRPE